jgi:hypothetical protein
MEVCGTHEESLTVVGVLPGHDRVNKMIRLILPEPPRHANVLEIRGETVGDSIALLSPVNDMNQIRITL